MSHGSQLSHVIHVIYIIHVSHVIHVHDDVYAQKSLFIGEKGNAFFGHPHPPQHLCL